MAIMTLHHFLPRILHHSSNNHSSNSSTRNSNNNGDSNQCHGDPKSAQLVKSHDRAGHQKWIFPLSQWHSRRCSDTNGNNSVKMIGDEKSTSCQSDPAKKKLERFNRPLCLKDFRLRKTLGTGTFARVWLVKLRHPHGEEKNQLFALKVLRKEVIIGMKQVEHVRDERSILASLVGHPFITSMIASFQDQDCLYVLLDYCPGGEVFGYLRRAGQFTESTSRLYVAEIVLVLQFLHESEGIAYRDLKPENILVDAQGHLKLVDFGFAKRVGNRETYTLCGTPEYLAPEIIRNTGHGRAVDWWALGIIIYEFLVGKCPFWDRSPIKIYEQILAGKVDYPTFMSADARSLIDGLCTVNVSKRLGNTKGGASTVMSHPWFRTIDWDAVYRRQTKGPITPVWGRPADTRNCNTYDHMMCVHEPYTEDMRKQHEEAFKDF